MLQNSDGHDLVYYATINDGYSIKKPLNLCTASMEAEQASFPLSLQLLKMTPNLRSTVVFLLTILLSSIPSPKKKA